MGSDLTDEETFNELRDEFLGMKKRIAELEAENKSLKEAFGDLVLGRQRKSELEEAQS